MEKKIELSIHRKEKKSQVTECCSEGKLEEILGYIVQRLRKEGGEEGLGCSQQLLQCFFF